MSSTLPYGAMPDGAMQGTKLLIRVDESSSGNLNETGKKENNAAAGCLSGRTVRRTAKCIGTILVVACVIATVVAVWKGLSTVLEPERFLELTYEESDPPSISDLGVSFTNSGQRLVVCVGIVAVSIAVGFFGTVLNNA